jgi:hypothetical protein
MSTVQPYVFAPPFQQAHLDKTSQWVSLTRAAAVAVVHDRVVEPWLATFAGFRYRCRFLQDGAAALDGIGAMLRDGVRLSAQHVALQLRIRGALPPQWSPREPVANATAVAALIAQRQASGAAPQQQGAGDAALPWERSTERGVPSWALSLRRFRTAAANSDGGDASSIAADAAAHEAADAGGDLLASAAANANATAGLDAANDDVRWPFPHCTSCAGFSNATEPRSWSRAQQSAVLARLFPDAASRFFAVVSDESLVKTVLGFYNLTGPAWQTGGFSTHVDWNRADEDGHPGWYSRVTLTWNAPLVRQVRAVPRQPFASSDAASVFL